MTILSRSTAIAAIVAAGSAVAVPASAQVNGIATSSPEIAIAKAQARITAYDQISQTYAAQIKQIGALREAMTQDQKSLDTNNDGQISDAEVKAKPSVVQQLQQKEQQAQTLSQPIAMAQTYALEQLIRNYDAARQQVISQKNIQIMLSARRGPVRSANHGRDRRHRGGAQPAHADGYDHAAGQLAAFA